MIRLTASPRTAPVVVVPISLTALVLVGWLSLRVAAQTEQALPDLVVQAARLQGSILIETDRFKASDCTVVNGCVGQAGWRKLLRFSVGISNTGTADLFFGNPADNPDLYEWDECDQEYELDYFVMYELLDQSGSTVVATGCKESFCLEDYAPVVRNFPPPKYNCSNQGISVGWSDVYTRDVDCQWIDITGVPAGKYQLRVTANYEAVELFNNGHADQINPKLRELDYTNNVATVPVTIR